MKTAIVFLADGMEECEALITVDLLRRAKINVITASIMKRLDVTSSHKITVKADALAEDVDYEAADIVILPGGMPGITNLGANEIVQEQCRKFAADKMVAAICAAPTVLAGLGILEGKKATCYPGCEVNMKGAIMTDMQAVVDGNIITGRSVGAAIPFALSIISKMLGDEAAWKTAEEIVYG